ncbi:MAG: hypothetical protein EON47_01170 [Acetobacteraceae bacterium]|nr:MAG: hypothetical protein EON47_01170 [Acetobacteraceae bacterium]
MPAGVGESPSLAWQAAILLGTCAPAGEFTPLPSKIRWPGDAAVASQRDPGKVQQGQIALFQDRSCEDATTCAFGA